MNLLDFTQTLGLKIRIQYPDINGHFYAQIEGGETKEYAESKLLCSATGWGKTPDDALRELAKELSEKVLVTNAMLETRKEFNVGNLEYPLKSYRLEVDNNIPDKYSYNKQ